MKNQYLFIIFLKKYIEMKTMPMAERAARVVQAGAVERAARVVQAGAAERAARVVWAGVG